MILYTLLALYPLLCFSDPFIKNIEIPSCRNCIYYKLDYNDPRYTYNKCSLFGKMDIITGEVKYDLARESRTNEMKCGIQGAHFEVDKLIKLKLFLRKVVIFLKNMYIVSAFLFACVFFLQISGKSK